VYNNIIDDFVIGLDSKNITFNYLAGDANCNGSVSLADALAILQYTANESKYPLTEQGIINADVYCMGDGITPMDAFVLQLADTGMFDSLPYSYK